MKNISRLLMNKLGLWIFFIFTCCLTACDQKHVPISSISVNQNFLQYQLINIKLLPDAVIEKFDSSVKKLWSDELNKNKNFVLLKNPDDTAVEETYLDDAELTLLKKGHTYRLRQYYQISETSNPVLPNILRKLNQGNASEAEIVYSFAKAGAGNSEVVESFHSEFRASDIFLSSEGRQITPGNSDFFTDMMANAGARGYVLDPLEQLKSNFKLIDLHRTFVVVSLERTYNLKLIKNNKSGSTDQNLMKISLVISFLRNSDKFGDPVYRVTVAISDHPAEIDSDLMKFSEKIRVALQENRIEATKVTSLDSADQIYRQLKGIQ